MIKFYFNNKINFNKTKFQKKSILMIFHSKLYLILKIIILKMMVKIFEMMLALMNI